MTTMKIQSGKNEMLDIWKMIAAFFVVCLHIAFPGVFGRFVFCMARFAVPLFFAISGYFSYGVRFQKAAKRNLRLLKLNAVCIILFFLWLSFENLCAQRNLMEGWLDRIPSVKGLADWFFLHLNPFGSHLWYLTAIVACYGVLMLYVPFFGSGRIVYGPLYALGAVLFVVEFAMADLLPLFVSGIPYYLFRNGWFIGLPMFALGIFLREHGDRIIENYHLSSKGIILLLLAGSALSALQWERFGPRELPLGAVVQVTALILLAKLHPVISGKSRAAQRITASFGFLSLFVYVAHLYIANLYAMFMVQPIIAAIGGQAEAWLRPFLIYGLSVIAGVLFLWLKQSCRKLVQKGVRA